GFPLDAFPVMTARVPMQVPSPRGSAEMKKSAALLFLLSCIVLSGCAATVKRPTAGAAPLAIPAVATTRIQLHVRGTPEMTASDDWTFFRTQWRTAMAEAAAAEGREFVWLDSLPSSFDGP